MRPNEGSATLGPAMTVLRWSVPCTQIRYAPARISSPPIHPYIPADGACPAPVRSERSRRWGPLDVPSSSSDMVGATGVARRWSVLPDYHCRGGKKGNE